MTEPVKDGGPAFPLPGDYTADGRGMSLRDYFAAQALTCMADAEALVAIRAEAAAKRCDPSEMVAAFVYDIADAMLKAREGR